MGHVNDLFDYTVSFYVLHPTEPKMAVHLHRNLKIWMAFGGHIELDENPAQTIEREMKEELGLTPDQYYILETYDAPEGVGIDNLPNPFGVYMFKYGKLDHWHIDLPYFIRSKTAELSPEEGEEQVIKWLSLDEMKELLKDKKTEQGIVNIFEWALNKDL